MNETLKILRDRKSVRVYTDEPITAEEKNAILSAALRAPTAGNMMLYSILDITDQNIKDALAKTCDNQPFIAKAPMVLVFCADYRRWMRKFAACGCGNGDPVKPEEGNLLLACNDTIIAAQTAVIAAESLGIGSCYIGDVLEQCETHIELLNLPEYVVPVSMVVFGHPTEGQKNRKQLPREPLKHIVFENGYRDLNDEELQEFSKQTNIIPFYERKHSSDFMKEMNRSSRAWITHWLNK